ncbi:hypothetical protein MMC29_004787, partial [Sticta canariensis]|nr:hypothetical protein [Sticta canariensis]
MVYCVATKRWWPFSELKAVKIVSKVLQSEELSYLFGTGDVQLSDPRNGLMLHRRLEKGVNWGDAVIVPVPAVDTLDNKVTRWELILNQEALRSKSAMEVGDENIYWKDLDKYIITYLMNKYLGLQNQLVNNQSKKYRGTMWCMPAPYVRNPMLRILAREISDFDLPKAMCAGVTFTDTSGSPGRSRDEENVMVIALGLKVTDERDVLDDKSTEEEDN